MERKARQITEYREGDSVNDLFIVRFKKPIRQARSGKYFFEAEIRDAKGYIMFKYWGSGDLEMVQAVYDSVKSDDVIKVVNGTVGSFNNRLDISVTEGTGSIAVLRPGEYEPRDFLGTSSRDPDTMMEELKGLLASVSNDDLRRVVDSFLSDGEFVERFKASPAAMHKHHSHVSGLLEHTLSVARICNDISGHHPKLDRELLLVGSFIHDIGKIEEFETTTQIKVSDEGNLVGHIALGVQRLTRKLDPLGIPDTLKQKLIHMVISHHGKLELGSPKVPSFPEAMLLNKVDELDAFVTQMTRIKEDANTEDSFVYSKDFGNIYLK